MLNIKYGNKLIKPRKLTAWYDGKYNNTLVCFLIWLSYLMNYVTEKRSLFYITLFGFTENSILFAIIKMINLIPSNKTVSQQSKISTMLLVDNIIGFLICNFYSKQWPSSTKTMFLVFIYKYFFYNPCTIIIVHK